MIVDDEPDILDIFREGLEQYGDLDVDVFDEPEVALAHFKENPSLYSLALIDIRMPGINGFELASALRVLTPSIKITLMTAYDVKPDDLNIAMLHLQWQSVLKKPLTIDKVYGAIKRQLQISR